MGFKSNQSEAFSANRLKPEGDYECVIVKIEERTTKSGAKGLNFTLVVRNDIPSQEYGNALLFYTIWRKKEPNENDMQVEGYNFAQLMAMGKAAALPDGKEYESLKAYCNDLLGRCVLATLEHEAYNGKEQERITWMNPTKHPQCRHKFKPSAPKAETYEPAQRGSSPQAADPIGDLADFEDVLTDDGVPF